MSNNLSRRIFFCYWSNMYILIELEIELFSIFKEIVCYNFEIVLITTPAVE